MAIQTPDKTLKGVRGFAAIGLDIVTDLPDMLIVSDAELDLLEAFLSALVVGMLNEPE